MHKITMVCKGVVSLLVALAVLLALIPKGGAQEPPGPYPPRFESEMGKSLQQKDPEGLYYCDGECLASVGLITLDTGGPDDFGYTWDDSVALNWIDATEGTDTGLGRQGSYTGPITIGFPFKYYENTYEQLYITGSGFVSFDDQDLSWGQSQIPLPSAPNNVIAPYWTPLELADTGQANRVYYMQGGVMPNRYFVIEWYEVISLEVNVFTFEAILYENGDIWFQYLDMDYRGAWYSGQAGIEDSEGLDGLAYTDFGDWAPSHKAVKFQRPAPAGRVQLRPGVQGEFTTAGDTVLLRQSIRNTGELGTDTYDLTVSGNTWPITLCDTNGVPLTDTDADGTVDTGMVPQGGIVEVVAHVEVPTTVDVGDYSRANLTARSSLDSGFSRNAVLQVAIPASFAQVFRDDADGAQSLYLVHPQFQILKKVTSDEYYGDDLAVAEMPDSFAYFWTRSRRLVSVDVGEIEYTLLDCYGETVRAVSKLTDHSTATLRTYDYDPAVAIAPTGRIGVLWYRYLSRQVDSTWQYNYNIYFAVLDASGDVVVPPTNLTNNNGWHQWTPPTYNVPQFRDPRIAATNDDRFVFAWAREHREEAGNVNDIYYAVRDTNGTEVRVITKVTNDTPGWYEGYRCPGLARLNGNQALLAWHRGSDYGIYYAVLDSAGNTIKAATNLAADGASQHDMPPDAVQLTDGKTVVAWTGGYADYCTRFAVLDTSYNCIAGPTTLSNPAAITGDAYVSVAADDAGHAILTWMDYDSSYRRNLYYALVDGNGNILTGPMIFRTSQATDLYIETSYEGYGSTSYNVTEAPTPTPTATPTDTPTPTATPTSTATATPTYTPTPTPTVTYRIYLPLILKNYP